MYYLKCSTCGHLNQLDNENLLFCSKCNKKLENNFRDWKRINSDSSLDDFKKLICISEQEIPSKITKPNKKKSFKYWIGFTITFALFYGGAQIGGEKLVSLFKSEKTSQEILSQEWITKTYGNYGLTVETPVVLIEKELAFPDQLKEVIEEISSSEYNTTKGFRVFVNSIKYKPIIQEISLQNAAIGAINEIKMMQGVTDFDYIEEEIDHNGIPGFKQTGTYKHKNIPIKFINIGYGVGLNIWQVVIAYHIDDEIGKIAAKRVIESIEIKNI
jgi:hypothetical protein